MVWRGVGLVFLVAVTLGCLGACRSGDTGTLLVSSAAFADGERIPVRYTCDGDNVSPPLRWSEPPEGTRSFAVVMDDPDARGWVHWVLFDLPGGTRALPERVPSESSVRELGVAGSGNAGLGYFGPCPPRGDRPHRYSFRVYALDARLGLPAGAVKRDVERAMIGHVLAAGELTGTYGRQG